MGGISGSLGYYLIGIQPDQGDTAVTWMRYVVEAAPSFEPNKVVNRYTMTDTGRDQGGAYTSVVSSKGDLPIYLHPDGIGLLCFLAMGSLADAGTTPHYTHTITPADDLPWFSVFRVVGGVITERFVDCKMDELKIDSKAGEPPVAMCSIIGITNTFDTEPVDGVGDDTIQVIAGDPYKHYDGKANYKIATVAQPIDAWTLDIKNNLLEYQADDFFLNDVPPGKREIDLDFSMHFQGPTTEPKYREFVYGSDGGTTVSTVLTAKAVEFKLVRDANVSIDFLMPQVRYSAVPVEPDPSGAPIEVQVATNVEKPTDDSDILTITVKDTNATYAA